jgi:hypothetical protein
MNKIIFQIKNAPEGGYTAKALGQNIFTEGDTWMELKVNVKDAVACHFDDVQNQALFTQLVKEARNDPRPRISHAEVLRRSALRRKELLKKVTK